MKTPPLSSDHTLHQEEKMEGQFLFVPLAKRHFFDARCIDGLHIMLKKHGDWMELESADEQKPAKKRTGEAWGRSSTNPNGGWFGLKKEFRGRFGMYIPRLMEALGLAILTLI